MKPSALLLALLALTAPAFTMFYNVRPATSGAAPTAVTTATAAPIDRDTFDKLLKKYVDKKGLVNYRGLKANAADLKEFNSYLAMLSKNPPKDSWSKAEQMAYWINAYNAYTIRLILDHYPLKSIKDIGSSIQIPLVTTPWAHKFFSIGNEKMSLDNIEHGILRKQYNDPRIHFALVCASLSCPRLRPEAYSAARLSQQLDEQGRDFLNNPAKNKITPAKAQLSKYFDWYKSDWNDNGQSVVKWVNKYSTTNITDNTPITYLDYNWSLNEQ